MEDSLKKRYTFKLTTNFSNLIFGLVTAIIIPRSLGPILYGNFSFIQNFFSRIITFLETGTSTAFYNKLSQRKNEFGLISFYSRICALVIILLLFITFILTQFKLINFVLPNQKKLYIYLGLIWGILYFLNNIFTKLMDSFSWTVISEIFKILIKFISIILLVIFFYANLINLNTYFSYFYFNFIIYIIVAFIIFNYKSKSFLKKKWRLNRSQKEQYFKEFFEYSHPIFMLQLIIMITSISERWMLEHFSGSIEQGFFGFADRLSRICFLFTQALIPLFMREFSIARSNNNLRKMYNLFRNYVPFLFALSSFIACFFIIHSSNIILIFGGDKYDNAIIPLTIMLFFPIHQSIAYLTGSVFYATNQTKIIRNIGIIMNIIGLLFTMLLILPKKYFGLALNSSGLAIKMVIIQFAQVNIMLYILSKYLKYSYLKYFFYQFSTILFFLIIAKFSKVFVDLIQMQALMNFMSSGILYITLVISITIFFPITFGMNKEKLKKLLFEITKIFK